MTTHILDTMQALRNEVVDLSPATLKQLAKVLKKWRVIVEEQLNIPADSEVMGMLPHLADKLSTAPTAPTAGSSTTLIADMAKFLPLFVEETEEGLETMQSHLLELESGVRKSGFQPPQSLIDELFRHAHKIKASAGAMGFTSLNEMTHTLETVLDRIRGGKLVISPDLVSTLLAALDAIRREVEVAKEGKVPSADLFSVRGSLMWYLDAPPETLAPLPRGQAPAPTNNPIPEFEGDSEKNARAQEEGLLVYKVAIYVKPSSPAPEMRLILALSRFAQIGTVLSASATADEIEHQPGLRTLTAWVSSKHPLDHVERSLKDPEAMVNVEALPDRETKMPELLPEPGLGKRNVTHSIRVPISRLDDLMNLSGELSISKNSFLSVSSQVRGWIEQTRSTSSKGEKIALALDEAISLLSQLAGGIQQNVLEMRMIPISPLFERCRRVVRDISHELGKEVELVLSGADTSLDKKIVDQMGDPLIHMVRNAIDHRIEKPQQRLEDGKAAHGTISMEAKREGSRIILTIQDDGRGIPIEAIRDKVIEQGLLTVDAANKLSGDELVPFIFSPGFSTAREITSISGRGVGMDIVRKRIEEINGTIEVKAVTGKGTTFRLSLPLTVLSQTCLLFDIHGVTFAFPLHNISEILRVEQNELLEMKFGKFLRLREELIPVFRLKHFFKNTSFKRSNEPDSYHNVILVRAGERRIGLIVDSLRGEEEILVKHPGALVGEIPGLAGVSVLSSGNVALILDVDKLVEKSLAEAKERHVQTHTEAAGQA